MHRKEDIMAKYALMLLCQREEHILPSLRQEGVFYYKIMLALLEGIALYARRWPTHGSDNEGS